MKHGMPFNEGAGHEYPDQAAVDAAVAGFHAGQDLDVRTFDLLANMPLRARWLDDGRGIVTNLDNHSIPLPDSPGAALYVQPGIRRLCAALDESAQGMWAQTTLAHAGTFMGRLAASPAYERVSWSGAATRQYEGDLFELFTEKSALQLVCFDSMDDSTILWDAGRIILTADRRLEPGGLLIIGGTVSEAGRQCLDQTIQMAHQYLDLRYDQEGPADLSDFPHTQYAIFGK